MYHALCLGLGFPFILAAIIAVKIQYIPPLGYGGETSCLNPITPNVSVSAKHPFTCGAQLVGKSDKMKVYAWIQPNGSWCWSNAGLVIDPEHKAGIYIDALTDTRLTNHMAMEWRKLLLKHNATFPRKMVYTHTDIDHVWGTRALSTKFLDLTEQPPPKRGYAQFEIVGSEWQQAALYETPTPKTYRTLVHVGHTAWHLLAPGGQVADWVRMALAVLPNFVSSKLVNLLGAVRSLEFFAPFDLKGTFWNPAIIPFRHFHGGESKLRVAGMESEWVRLVVAQPAHSATDTMVLVESAGVAFAGDLLFLGSTPIQWHGPAENFLQNLNYLRKTTTLEWFVPGHGPVTDRTGLEHNIEYWEFIQREGMRCFHLELGAEECGLQALEKLPPFWKAQGDQQRIFINLWVELEHHKLGFANKTSFKITPPEKLSKLFSQGTYLVKLQLGLLDQTSAPSSTDELAGADSSEPLDLLEPAESPKSDELSESSDSLDSDEGKPVGDVQCGTPDITAVDPTTGDGEEAPPSTGDDEEAPSSGHSEL